MKLDILFRCDYGQNYGYGHLMRCISLSQAFGEYKEVNLFCFTRSSIKGFKKIFESSKITYIKLSKSSLGLYFNPSNFIENQNRIITIFDNYDVTLKQMNAYKKIFPNLVAIDDMADRYFNVDIIVNQNIGSNSLKYNLKNSSKLLLGEKYALLRKNILTAKMNKKNKNIFMSFGGGEVYNRIKKILDFLIIIDKELHHKVAIDFILSGNNDSKNKIINYTTVFKNIKFNFIQNENDLSKYMVRADFAITASGSTVFELAYLGIPQLVLIIDSNQEVTGKSINKIGLGVCLGQISELNEKDFITTFKSFLNDKNLKNKFSNDSKSIIDGHGSKRVADFILKYYGTI